MDEFLGIASSTLTVGARELCCRVSVSGVSFAKAAENLERLGQIRVSKERMRDVVEREGQAVVGARRFGDLGPDWTATECKVSPGGTTRVMVGADGVMVPTVTEREKQKRREGWERKRLARAAGERVRRQRKRRRQAVKGADQGFKEFKIGVFYDDSREHQYAFATAGNHEEFGRQVRREAAKVKLQEAHEKVAVTDGAKWIARQMRIQLPMVDPHIVDWHHFSEHVAQAARECWGEGTAAAQAWREGVLNRAYQEGPGAVLAKIVETLRTLHSPRKRKALRQLQQYITTRTAMLDYPAFRAKGYDIGSGPTEAFCKVLPSRLKGSGMRWDQPNAEALMALSALEHSHQWKSYWDRQLAAAA